MSELKLTRLDAEEIRYGHTPGGGLFAVAAGIAVSAVAARSSGIGAAIAVGMGAFFVLAGAIAVLWRDELRLDTVRRVFHRRRGFWPVAKRRTARFDEIAGLALKRDHEYRRGERVDEWEVWLEFTDTERSVRLHENRDESEARRTLDMLAARLGVPVRAQ